MGFRFSAKRPSNLMNRSSWCGEVYFCNDDNVLAINVRLNRCVAIERGLTYMSFIVGMPAPHGHFDDDEDEVDDDDESGGDGIKK